MNKSNRGITLIALVVTIIILIILATVSITLVLNSEGILGQAKKAKELAENDQVKTDIALNMLYDQIANGGNGENLPDNTPDTGGGTPVKPNENWGKAGVYTVSDKTGEILETAPFQMKTVYAVADGKGNTIPVPNGFYYVGGTKDTGVVISDNAEDQNKYVGSTDVPSGIELKEDGSLNYVLKGNLFVWIPCTKEEYKQYIWSSYQNNTPEPRTSMAERVQVEKYGGFYVGRYEAGLAEDIPEYTTTQTHTGSNQVYNKEGIPQSKAGIMPWNYISTEMAKANAEKMYDTASVQSGLITGTQWDRMVIWIGDGENSTSITSNCNWGNYYNVELNYTGRIAKHYVSGNSWYSEPLSAKNQNGVKAIGTSTTAYLLSTGATEQAKKKNIYDVAGNLYERTEEYSLSIANVNSIRGGSMSSTFVSNPACSRDYATYKDTNLHIGFRTVLYIK